MSDHEPIARRIVRPILALLIKWFWRENLFCSVCEQPYAACACEVDQANDDVILASLRQEIRYLRGLLLA